MLSHRHRPFDFAGDAQCAERDPAVDCPGKTLSPTSHTARSREACGAQADHKLFWGKPPTMPLARWVKRSNVNGVPGMASRI